MAPTVFFAPISSALSVTESASTSGNTGILFTVFLSEPSTEEVTVQYRTLDGTATAETDFFGIRTATLTFAAGETQKTIKISGISDGLSEFDEAMQLELFNPDGAVLQGNAISLRQSAFISDDDGSGNKLSLFVSAPTIVESNRGQRLAVFTVTLSEPAAQELTFDYATRDGSAVAGEDFVAATGTLTFAPGQSVLTVSVPVLGEIDAEASETFHLVVTPTDDLADSGAGAVGTATILDNDTGAPTLSLAATRSVGESGSTSGNMGVTYFLTLSEASDEAVTVKFRTLEGTAASGTDFFSIVTQTVTFNPGETSKTIVVNGISDGLSELDQALLVEAFDPVGAVFAGGYRTLRESAFILDDDGGGGLKRALFVHANSVDESNEDSVEVRFVVKVSRPFEEETTLTFTTLDGTAKAGRDYVPTSGTITFAAGQMETVVTVQVRKDFRLEGGETFSLNVTGPYPASLATPVAGTSALVTIFDKDIGGTSSPNDLVGTEGSEGLYGLAGSDTIQGLGGDDLLVGAVGEDHLFGGNGDDTLDGGLGRDTLTGGLGEDVFVMRDTARRNVATDFAVADDIVDLRFLDLADMDELLASGAIVGKASRAVIDLAVFGQDGSLVLNGVDADDLTAANFLL
jgi:Ca2+-binding RTX toxin-like protein